MKVSIRYHAQIRQAAGMDRESVDVGEGGTALDALRAAEHGPAFSALLLDDQRNLRPSILLLVNDVPADAAHPLQAGDRVSVFSPVAGG